MMQGYKTIAFNLVMAIVAIIKINVPETEMLSTEEITAHFDKFWAAFSYITVIGNGVLRFFTKGPVFTKNEQGEK